MSHGVNVGDVFVCSWGYDQTNVDAFIVTATTPSTVKIMKAPMTTVGEDGGTRLIPDRTRSPIPFDPDRNLWRGKINADGTMTKRVRVTTGDWASTSIKLADYAYAYLHDGERSYYDTLVAGHPGH